VKEESKVWTDTCFLYDEISRDSCLAERYGETCTV